jgi:hypothetical protein
VVDATCPTPREEVGGTIVSCFGATVESLLFSPAIVRFNWSIWRCCSRIIFLNWSISELATGASEAAFGRASALGVTGL